MNNLNTQENATDIEKVEFRRKRVKRIKRLIVVTVFVLLVLPTILCIVMFFKMSQLQSRIEDLEYSRSLEAAMTDKYASLQTIPTQNYESESPKPTKVVATAKPQASVIPSTTSKPKPTKEVVKTKAPQATKDAVSDDTKTTLQPQATNKVVIPPVEKSSKENPKRIYLTFDDGPSTNTSRILDILKKYDVKATFFVNGKDSQLARDMYKRIVDEGHTLAMHSYSHDYEQIYSSVDAFAKDMNKLSNYLENVTGVKPKYYRFPGGSSTSLCKKDIRNYIKYLNSKGVKHFDWNAQNSDAQKTVLTKEELIANVIDGVNRHDDTIVLMHDAKSRDNTVESLPQLIELLQQSGAILLPIDDNTPSIVHIGLEE